MKLNNYTVVFDLETTDKEENREIIQIGAVLLDKELNYVDYYVDFVHTTQQLSDFVKTLTGITQDNVDNAPRFPDVAFTFEKWIADKVGRSPKGVKLAAWGTYFDIPLLRNAYKIWNLQYPFSGTAICVKSLAHLWLAVKGSRTDKMSVKDMVEKMALCIEGNYHDALVDAKATADIFRRIFEDFHKGFFLENKHYKISDETTI